MDGPSVAATFPRFPTPHMYADHETDTQGVTYMLCRRPHKVMRNSLRGETKTDTQLIDSLHRQTINFQFKSACEHLILACVSRMDETATGRRSLSRIALYRLYKAWHDVVRQSNRAGGTATLVSLPNLVTDFSAKGVFH